MREKSVCMCVHEREREIEKEKGHGLMDPRIVVRGEKLAPPLQ